MRLDHLIYAAESDGLAATTTRLGERLGARFYDGGTHPRFGTQNAILPLRGGEYVEVVEVLDHPASDKAAFGQAVRARSAVGGGWLGWAVAVDDISVVEARLQLTATPGSRHRPDGVELSWKQIGVSGLQTDPQLPFFVHWDIEPRLHPGSGGGEIALSRLEIAGSRERVARWLGTPSPDPMPHVKVVWLAPHGTPGLLAASFETPGGVVRI
jgi:Glyoxalase-like domain